MHTHDDALLECKNTMEIKYNPRATTGRDPRRGAREAVVAASLHVARVFRHEGANVGRRELWTTRAFSSRRRLAPLVGAVGVFRSDVVRRIADDDDLDPCD